MHKKSGIALILAGLLFGCANQPGGSQGETLDLGDSQRVSRLFAYPNNCSVICYRDRTLEQTVEHYLQQSLTRDGYPQASVRVTRNGERVQAHFAAHQPNTASPCCNCSMPATWPIRAPVNSIVTANGSTTGTSSCHWAWHWRTARASNCCTSHRITH